MFIAPKMPPVCRNRTRLPLKAWELASSSVCSPSAALPVHAGQAQGVLRSMRHACVHRVKQDARGAADLLNEGGLVRR